VVFEGAVTVPFEGAVAFELRSRAGWKASSSESKRSSSAENADAACCASNNRPLVEEGYSWHVQHDFAAVVDVDEVETALVETALELVVETAPPLASTKARSELANLSRIMVSR
jgi:hypothetical protein